MKLSDHFPIASLFKAPLVFLLALALLPCFSAPARAADADYAAFKGEAEGGNGLKISWRVVADLPGKEKDDADNAWLVVQPSLNGKELPAVSKESDYTSLPDLPLVYIEDFNFDGRDDLFLVEGQGTHGAYGEVQLFNPGAGRFEPSENLIAFYTVDKKRKRLLEAYHDSACENGEREYIVKGFDELELVFEQGAECPEDLLEKNQYRAFKRAYKDGELVSEEEEIRKVAE